MQCRPQLQGHPPWEAGPGRGAGAGAGGAQHFPHYAMTKQQLLSGAAGAGTAEATLLWFANDMSCAASWLVGCLKINFIAACSPCTRLLRRTHSPVYIPVRQRHTGRRLHTTKANRRQPDGNRLRQPSRSIIAHQLGATLGKSRGLILST